MDAKRQGVRHLRAAAGVGRRLADGGGAVADKSWEPQVWLATVLDYDLVFFDKDEDRLESVPIAFAPK